MRRLPHNGGFTAAEMLVATMIGSLVVGAAALAFSTLTSGQRQFAAAAKVQLPAGAQKNFYAIDSDTITTHVAPNLGSVALAEAMRERFYTDVAQAVAVYCLYRPNNTWNTIRPTSLAAPSFGTAMDTPEAFRAYLVSITSGASSIFSTYRNFGSTPNISIFVLGYSSDATSIPVLAVYDMDFVAAYDPSASTQRIGTYASVRRYAGGQLTQYYDVVYPTSGQTESWAPPVVAFERRSRKAITEGASIDPFKVAAGMPFYFIFWPDPAEDSLAVPSDAMPSSILNGNYSSTDPRRAYNHMAGRTSYMFTVPMFPCQ